MASSNDLEIVIVVTGAVLCAAGIYIIYYPHTLNKLMSFFYSESKGNINEAIAGYRPKKIQVSYNLSPDEKSQLLNTMKNLLENLTDPRQSEYPTDGGQLHIPFIPEDDEDAPDLSIDGEGPEISEEEETQETDYVKLGELLN